MSKRQVRAEKICLNSGERLQARYCPICGQENIEPKENIWQLISHLFRDIAHVDGKFLVTLKLLLFRPGFLSKAYLLGRRVRYIDPIKMHIFTAFLFLLFCSHTSPLYTILLMKGIITITIQSTIVR